MATTAKSNLIFQRTTPINYPIDTTGANDINQGDLVYLDTVAHLVKSAASDANCANLVGVALDSSFVQPYNTKQYGTGQIPVGPGDVYVFNTTAADTYFDGTALYFGVDAQTVTAVVGTNIIGYAKMTPGVASVAGGAGVTLNVLVIAKNPSSGVA